MFILGITNHWVTLLLCKSSHNVGVLYLDSNNEPVLLASDDDLQKLVAQREEKHIKKKGTPYSDWKRGNILQGFVDQRNFVKLIWECAAGIRDLRSELLTTSWCRIIDSYNYCVSSVLNESRDNGLYTALLLQWLEQHYCPQTIKNTHITLLHSLGLTLSEEPVIAKVKSWAEHCQQYILERDNTSCGIESVDRFNMCICQLMTALNNVSTTK